MWVYLFDGTFIGLLTAVFERYDRKQHPVRIAPQQRYAPGLMDEPVAVVSDDTKARRVWQGLGKRLNTDWMSRLYAAFLGEQPEGFQHLFDLACYIINHGGDVIANYGNPHVLYVAQLHRKVHREKHRMEAFVRFQQLADGIFFALVEPDFNVLPLISRHFKNRYADQRWTIYDRRRDYGIHYDGSGVSEVTIDFIQHTGKHRGVLPADLLAEQEVLYQTLWQGYFKNATIPSRKNTTLHIRHVPRRYWKHLTEKAFLPLAL
ncbi:TIGR03915 family putative DNA repair protein [Parapedobacter koreensis]|uniref:Probable DNA metabolism protein n=1 Tax=Parapedobacter koreensis TaxID=332977 RepID=A0A1H7EX56_9SPHI|nr:TIGR03915 family putative DNA repair protein [Parapedobacter koreensis]SEK17687.1 probable DNA metabolism protein [Parapedobacter koreensis]